MYLSTATGKTTTTAPNDCQQGKLRLVGDRSLDAAQCCPGFKEAWVTSWWSVSTHGDSFKISCWSVAVVDFDSFNGDQSNRFLRTYCVWYDWFKTLFGWKIGLNNYQFLLNFYDSVLMIRAGSHFEVAHTKHKKFWLILWDFFLGRTMKPAEAVGWRNHRSCNKNTAQYTCFYSLNHVAMTQKLQFHEWPLEAGWLIFYNHGQFWSFFMYSDTLFRIGAKVQNKISQ